jgi:hypothetical protein
MRARTCCVCVCASVWRWMAFNHLLPFCSKSKHRATTNLFSFQSSAGRPVHRRKMLPHPVQEHQPSEEMMSERELRGEDKGCERCSFCTLLADLNKRRKINNTPRGCLSSSVCSTRSLTHSLSHTHTQGIFHPLEHEFIIIFPVMPKAIFSSCTHIVRELRPLSLSLIHLTTTSLKSRLSLTIRENKKRMIIRRIRMTFFL